MSGEAFEGVEKRLYIEFKKEHDGRRLPSLRDFPTEVWSDLLTPCECQILSQVATAGCTCYLLSESSLFVYDACIMLKTCGTTKPLSIIQPLVTLLYRHGDDEQALPAAVEDAIDLLLFSHLTYRSSKSQQFPHRSIEEECGYLYCVLRSSFLETDVEEGHRDGKSIQTGGVFLPTLENRGLFVFAAKAPGASLIGGAARYFLEIAVFGIPESSTIRAVCGVETGVGDEPRQASLINSLLNGRDGKSSSAAAVHDGGLAIMRTIPSLSWLEDREELNVEKNSDSDLVSLRTMPTLSWLENGAAGLNVEQSSATLDEYWFTPQGYSCNLLFGQKSHTLGAVTIHVSPEPATSFLSVEWHGPLGGPEHALSTAITEHVSEVQHVHVIRIACLDSDDGDCMKVSRANELEEAVEKQRFKKIGQCDALLMNAFHVKHTMYSGWDLRRRQRIV